MDINYFLGGLRSELNYLTAGVVDRKKAVEEMKADTKKGLTAQLTDLRVFAAELSDIRKRCFEKYPAESISKKQEMEYWWDRIAGGWSTDRLPSS